MRISLIGLRTYAPVKTPVFSFAKSVRSRSFFFAARCTYACTAARCACVVSAVTASCSGASTRYVTPKSVSARVVYTRIVCGSLSCTEHAGASTGKSISAPQLFPIQLRCICLTDSGQSSSSKSERRRSAYAVIRTIHWRTPRRVTSAPQRSQHASLTSSFARPVLQLGHQLMGAVAS